MSDPSITCPRCMRTSYNSRDISEKYCGFCHAFTDAPRLLSDKIAEFIDWMEESTDFGEWDAKVRFAVHKKLIEFLTQR